MKYLRKLLGLECKVKQYGIVRGKIYVQKCKHCGKLHNHKMLVN